MHIDNIDTPREIIGQRMLWLVTNPKTNAKIDINDET